LSIFRLRDNVHIPMVFNEDTQAVPDNLVIVGKQNIDRHFPFLLILGYRSFFGRDGNITSSHVVSAYKNGPANPENESHLLREKGCPSETG